MPAREDLAALETPARKWCEVEAGQDAHIATLTPALLSEPLSYVSFSGDSFTRQLGDGRKATSTDYLRFADAQKGL